jgi:DNA-binding transcriptional LysR family regulator
MGLTITSSWMFSPELESGAVQRVLADWLLPPIDLLVVYPTGRMPSSKARAFVAFVEAKLTQASSEPETVTVTPREATCR